MANISENMTVFEFFRVRVMTGEPKTDGTCIAVEEFKEFPTDADVIKSVLDNKGSYAEITKILVPQLPSTDGDISK